MAHEINIATAATVPFTAKAEHEQLLKMVGDWEGTSRIWLDPTAAPDETPVRGNIVAVLGGRFVRYSYEGTAHGDAQAGAWLLGYDGSIKSWAGMWVDSWHNRTAMMSCLGAPSDDGAIRMLGGYTYEGQRYGWRTEFRQPGADSIVIDAYYITLEGEESHAIQVTLSRVKG